MRLISLLAQLLICSASVINPDELNQLFVKANAPAKIRGGLDDLVDLRTSSLFQALGEGPRPTGFQVVNRHKSGQVSLLSGLLRDESGSILGDAIVARREGSDWALVSSHSNEIESVKIQGNTSLGSEYDYTVTQEDDDEVEDEEELERYRLGANVEPHEGAEMDSAGNVVIDVLCAVHSAAMSDIGSDVEGICLAMLEALNLSLKLTGIDNVRMRVVAAIQEDVPDYKGSLSARLKLAQTHFSSKRAEYGADHIVYLQSGSEGVAYRPGWIVVGGVRALSVIRHEIGHNINISHCPVDKDSYYGHKVPETNRGTIMCGNHIPVFATENLTDFGYPTGRTVKGGVWKESADSNAANGWIKNAAAHSAYLPRKYPFDEEERIEIISKKHVLWKSGQGLTEEVSFIVPEGAKTVMVLVVTSADYKGGEPELFVGKNATAPYEYQVKKHWTSGVNYVLMKNPTANDKYFINVDETVSPNRKTSGYEITVYGFKIPSTDH